MASEQGARTSHEEKYQKQLEFLENYLDTIRREVDEKTRELDELKLQALHVQNANAFEEFELATKNKLRKREEKNRNREQHYRIKQSIKKLMTSLENLKDSK